MIELSRTQDEEVGDGTTSVIILGDTVFYVMHLQKRDVLLLCAFNVFSTHCRHKQHNTRHACASNLMAATYMHQKLLSHN